MQHDGDLVVIDTETTGLGPQARVVEIACLVLDHAGRITHEWETLIDPTRGPGPTAVHGIDRSMLAAAPPFAEVAGQIEHHLRGRVPVGHNLSYDWRVLRQEFRRLGVDMPPSHGGVCTRDLSRRFAGTGMGLAALCARLGVEHERPHSARSDAESTARVLQKMARAGLQIPSGRPCPAFGRAWALPRSARSLPRTDASRATWAGARR